MAAHQKAQTLLCATQVVFVCLVLNRVSHTLGERGDPVSRYNAVYGPLGSLARKRPINNAFERCENDYYKWVRARGKSDSRLLLILGTEIKQEQ